MTPVCPLSREAVEHALFYDGEQFLNYILRVYLPRREKNNLLADPIYDDYDIHVVDAAWISYIDEGLYRPEPIPDPVPEEPLTGPIIHNHHNEEEHVGLLFRQRDQNQLRDQNQQRRSDNNRQNH